MFADMLPEMLPELLRNWLIAVVALLVLVAGWVAVQQLARRFAEANPECGPFREAGGGCGGCAAGHCGNRGSALGSIERTD